jgi:hypothetical protein
VNNPLAAFLCSLPRLIRDQNSDDEDEPSAIVSTLGSVKPTGEVRVRLQPSSSFARSGVPTCNATTELDSTLCVLEQPTLASPGPGAASAFVMLPRAVVRPLESALLVVQPVQRTEAISPQVGGLLRTWIATRATSQVNDNFEKWRSDAGLLIDFCSAPPGARTMTERFGVNTGTSGHLHVRR